ncbi:MAG: hypothetical protein ACYTEQ_25975 [Planctomycetota bacterium]|jgi:hypothetical protein
MRIRLPGFDVDKLARKAIAYRVGCDTSHAEIVQAFMVEVKAFIEDSIEALEGSEKFHELARTKEGGHE